MEIFLNNYFGWVYFYLGCVGESVENGVVNIVVMKEGWNILYWIDM